MNRNMVLFSDFAKKFYADLRVADVATPENVEWLLPQLDPEVRKLIHHFYDKYYADSHKRTIVLGINPGRHGAGVTGIPFSDPVQLSEKLGINNALPKRTELSAVWVHELIEAYGGPELFHQTFYISSVCPLGFVRSGKNFNYYDDAKFALRLHPYIFQMLKVQLEMPIYRNKAICWGKGKNASFLQNFNEEYRLFEEICVLPHPRWIMQYQRKKSDYYLDLFVHKMQAWAGQNSSKSFTQIKKATPKS